MCVSVRVYVRVCVHENLLGGQRDGLIDSVASVSVLPPALICLFCNKKLLKLFHM